MQFEKTEAPGVCRIRRTAAAVVVRYGAVAMAMRALSAIMAGLAPRSGELIETAPFTTFGMMLDCSRNAIMKVEYFKKWLRRLTLLGYNMAMLYTADTYEIRGEDYFGYLRGSYTAGELREIDDYAAALGIEMVACIQALGHLDQVLKWPAYRDVTDTNSELLVGEKKTYELLEKMIGHWHKVFRSRRIHIGMDETGDLGRGRYLDRHGWRPSLDVYNEHLARAAKICGKYGLAPMIWSDMYFVWGSKRHWLYDPKAVIPRRVVKSIPQAAQLVYWNYYNEKPEIYLNMIKAHRRIGKEPVMASGVWTWYSFWHNRKFTEKHAGACIAACRQARLKEIFFTLWMDGGGYCDIDSGLAGLAFVAEKAYAGSFSEKALAKRFRAVCGANYHAQILASDLETETRVHRYSASLLWDDPLLAIMLSHKRAKGPGTLAKMEAHYAALARKLKPYERETAAGRIRHARLLAATLAAKIGLAKRLCAAYAARDRKRLMAVQKEIPALIGLLEKAADSFRSIWMERNKPFGLEVQQIQMAGIIARYRELDRRLSEYLAGRGPGLPELDANAVPPRGEPAGYTYRHVAMGSMAIRSAVF
ncbi:MAG: family 20 glycosylhydrolase [Kiritimatiellota bacterium]|nr:family 20 glycosylhydrolase [Kiritimatiellota bacterium]